MLLEKLINKNDKLKTLDITILRFMRKHGKKIEHYLLGGYFLWFGLLKVFGGTSASSIIAKSIYYGDPSISVPILGIWEAIIGLSLISFKLQRLAIFLLILRIPGVFLALILKYDECFHSSILEPTIQGQYLIKQITLFGAALVIGSSIQRKTN